jgi:ABC-type multidrug transport system fused ATPase/permease subunit|tara:strand:- start:2796 stop:4553 length:1758 start_codon:yes stop_codon:yes gene_type:complete
MIKEKDKKEFDWINLIKGFWYFLEDKKLKFSFWASMNLLGNFAGIIVPILIGLIINFFTSYSQGDSLMPFYTYSIAITLVLIFFTSLKVYSKIKINEIKIHTIHNIKSRGFERLTNFSLIWHAKEGSGNKIQKMDKLANSIGDFLDMINGTLLSIGSTLIGTTIVFIFLNRSFLVFFIIYIFLFFLIEKHFNIKLHELNDLRNKSLEKASGIYYEGTSNILSVKSLGMEKAIVNRIAFKEEQAKQIGIQLMKHRLRKNQVFQIVNSLAIGSFLLLIGASIVKGALTVGFIATYYAYFNRIKENLWAINNVTPKLIEIKSSVARGIPIFLEKQSYFFGKEKFNTDWSKISLKDIYFSYNKKINLKKVSLDIFKGDKIGIVGDSGSGKSTFGKILLGLYKVKSGKISIDNKDYYETDHENILKNISSVLQETELFDMTLKENITILGKPDNSLFKKAIKIAQLEDVIKNLPKGINTLLGEKGYKLSGGERQRIGIARAIYKNPGIMILDEATSALDTKTELGIQRGIENLENKTMLIIAHRISTLKNVDRIIVFDKGKIVEQGNFKDLIKNKNSKFYKLWSKERKKI